MAEPTEPRDSRIPSTVLTFLIADVRGYTRFTAQQGDEAASRLASAFAEMVEEVVTGYEGNVIELRGDEALATFTSARNALRASLAIQDRLRSAVAENASLPLNVGIGLDAGDAIPVKGGYRGGALNLAARLCSIAGTGEIFASETVTGLARKTDGIVFVDRGRVTLKGLLESVRVVQIGREGELEVDAPPLQPLLTSHPTNLPDDVTPFIGRTEDIAGISRLLRAPGVRLVTLTGAGGSGKTRLALQVAALHLYDFRDGIFFVPLAQLSDTALLPSAISAALSVREEAPHDLLDTLRTHLKDKLILLVLDNFEHLQGAAPTVGLLLDECRDLHVLVTSRSPLRLKREHEYPVPPLLLPDGENMPDVAALEQYDAIALFLERARAIQPGFEVTGENARAVVEICTRLDGLPLALELAAARLRILTPHTLLSRLDQRLPLLTSSNRDAPQRQRTLRAAIEWSHALLSDIDAQLFARLGVFAGSFDADAAESVCDADLDALQTLIEQSLLRVTEDGRFIFLQTMREFALEKLQATREEREVRQRHLDYFLRLARSANLMNESEGVSRHDLVIRDQSNVRAALQWTIDTQQSGVGLHLASALENFWVTNAPREGNDRLRDLMRGASNIPDDVRAVALRVYGATFYILGLYREGMRHYEESLALYRSIGDERGIGILLLRIAFDALRVGDLERARKLNDEALSLHQKIGFIRGEAQSLGLLATLETKLGNHERALELNEQTVYLVEKTGFTWWHVLALLDLVGSLIKCDRFEEAKGRVTEALTLAITMGDRLNIVFSLALRAQIASQEGDSELAGHLWGAIEADVAREPLAQWPGASDRYLTSIRATADAHFDIAREAGHRISLSTAASEALTST